MTKFMTDLNNDFNTLFETSWEVCNKVGGIYTVLSTKAKTLKELYGDNVIFIGPDVWTADKPSPFFTELKDTPLSGWLAQNKLPQDVKVRVGRWNIPGNPLAVLVKFDAMYHVKNELYGSMWQNFAVDSLHAYGDYDEGCAFAHASALVIADIARFREIDQIPGAVMAHFDEWTTGMGLLALKLLMPAAATVFTTHATCIGRSICGNGKPLYDYLYGYNGDQMARELNMQSKHSLEKSAAHHADAFTTVSGITARECQQLLEKEVDTVTPNGFETGFVPSGMAYDTRRRQARKALLDVASALTGKQYRDDTFILATSGRFEYRNKGLDVFLDAMASLRQTYHGHRPIVAFIMVPAWCAGARTDVHKAIADGVENTVTLPHPFYTHTVHNPYEDAIMCRIRQLGLDAPASNLQVIYVPCYLNGDDGIFNLSYYDLLVGMDATVFASYYEPWGYTPLESVAFGVPTVTTSLAGFGDWVKDNFQNNFRSCGVKVLERNDSNYHDVVKEIDRSIRELVQAPADTMNEIRKAASTTASMASWSNFIVDYLIAYRKAFAKAFDRAYK